MMHGLRTGLQGTAHDASCGNTPDTSAKTVTVDSSAASPARVISTAHDTAKSLAIFESPCEHTLEKSTHKHVRDGYQG